MSEYRSKLPDGWSICKLEEIAEINPKFNQHIANEVDVTFIPMRMVEEESGKIDLSITKKYLEVRKGYTTIGDDDIIFAKITPCMENGKVAIAKNLINNIAFGSTEFHVVRLGKDLPRKYYFYFLVREEFRKTARSKMTGSAGQLRVPADFLEKSELPFPPFPEQHRIVAKIEELFTKLDVAVDELRKAKAQIKRYRQSVLKSAFEGKLTEKWRSERREVRNETAEELLAKIKEERKKTLGNKYKELPPVDTTNLQPLPEGWMWTCLGDIITVSSGNGLTSSNMKSDGRYAVYGGNGISGYYDKYMFEKQKLIIGRVGAKCGVVHITEPNSWITDNALIVEFKNLDMKFMFYLIHVLNLNQHSVSTAQPVISGAKIYPIINPLPPFNEQQQIVSEIERHFSVADSTEKIIDQSLKQAERLRQSILKDAFAGKLVPQDPNDEPAAKLLERIKEEKQKEAEQKALVKTNIKKRKKSK
jgi:type I restriction enzyme S subunit